MTNSFAKAMGFNWPRDLAYVINGRRVTWSEVRASRIARQREHLRRVLDVSGADERAAFVWTFYVPGVIYGGWHLYIRTITESLWLRNRFPWERLIREIMVAFPSGCLPSVANFDQWKEAFAKQYPRQGKRREGVAFGFAQFDNGRIVSFRAANHAPLLNRESRPRVDLHPMQAKLRYEVRA